MPFSALAAELPDLGGKKVVVVTENAYPPLQFVDPKTGKAIGWEYDAMNEIAKRLNFKVEYQNTSWDAMIQAVSDGQYNIGMTGITIKDERKQKVDFSDPYMRSQQFMLVRGDENRFTDAKSFGDFNDGLVGAQPGTTPFYTAVYEMLDGNEQNPRIKLFETFGATVQALKAGDVDVVLTDSAAAKGYVDASERRAEGDRRAARHRGFRLHLPEGLGSRRAGQCRDRRAEGRRHVRRAEQEVVPRLQDGRMMPTAPMAARRSADISEKGDYPWWLVALVVIAVALAAVIVSQRYLCPGLHDRSSTASASPSS